MALALLAGCSSPAPGAGPAAASEAVPAAFAWSGCAGGSALLRMPTPLLPQGGPSGWARDGSPTSDIQVVALRCERVSWGAFERGPVGLVLERRSDVAPPAGCMAETDRAYGLQSLWSSDPDVAAFARDAYGMPAVAGDVPGPSTSATGQEEWSWSVPGQPASTLRLADSGGQPTLTGTSSGRYFWAAGDAVGALDLRMDRTVEAFPLAASGVLQPPMLYAEASPVPDYVSPNGAHLRGAEVAGDLHRYGDPGCEHPL